MEEQFVPYEESLELKELGFNRECLADYFAYNDLNQTLEGIIKLCITEEDIAEYCKNLKLYQFWICSAPLWQQAFDWFREKYKIYPLIFRGMGWEYELREDNNHNNKIYRDGTYNTYEEARLECLRKLIQIVKDGRN